MSSTEKNRKIDINKLQVGMYVTMPVSWAEHPFLVNHFRISSPSQIEKMRKAGMKSVMVDFSRSGLDPDSPEYRPERAVSLPDVSGKLDTDLTEDKKKSHNIILESIKEAVSDKTLPPDEKVKIVYQRSVKMISDVLEQPTIENIGGAKESIIGIVDMILSEKETANFLLRITSHDFNTYTHSVNVGFYSVCLAKNLFYSNNVHNMHELGAAFFLHDLGKVGTPLGIISKPGPLTDPEMDSIRQHPIRGFNILQEARQVTEECKTVVLQHHERYDGTGYPEGLCGEAIHIYARICSIADVYDALTSDRPYRDKMQTFQALRLMKDEMINHFQKELFERFVLLFA
jgi:HD-GYP domain-containing protein (c-di-GMP phosphodiesterase class II)